MALVDNLVAYWKLDGNSNGSVSSLNGSDTDITYSSSNGIINQGAGFNGSSSKIDFGNPSEVDITGNITVNVWAKFSSLGTYPRIIGKGIDTGSTNIQYSLGYHNALNKFYWVTSSGTSTYKDAYVVTPTNGSWYMVTGVMNGSNMIIYVNGGDKTTGAATTSLYSSSENLIAGSNGSSNFLTGAVDEIGIWNRALSDAEITSLYNSGSGYQPVFTSIKAVNGLAYGSVKSVNGLAVASVKNINGLV